MTVKIPTSPEALEESLSDKATVKALFEGPDDLKAYVKGYAENFAKADKGATAEQIREQVLGELDGRVQAEVAKYLKEHPAEKPTAAVQRVTGMVPNTPAGRALFRDDAPGARLNGTFDSIGSFIQAHYGPARVRAKYKDQLARYGQIMNSFGSEVPDAGGFLIPEHLRSEILQVALESAVVRPRATVIPMDSLRVPIPMIDDTSHVSNVLGGVQWYWTEEAAALTESQASFGRVVLDAKKLTAYAKVPNELLQDAPAFNGFLEAKFPLAIAYGEDVGFITGSGVGEPLGYISCAASVNVAKESGQAAATVVWENVIKQYARMLPTSLGSAVWVANIETFPQIATMAASVGTGGSAVWVGNYTNPGANTPPTSILGRPVIFTEKAQALGTPGDLAFVDLSYYLIGDRMQMEAMSSEHFLFDTDRVAYRVIERVDGRPWIQSAITPHLGSSSLTPFVQIASR